MNERPFTAGFTPAATTPTDLGTDLFEAAQRRQVALSDAEGCATHLRFANPRVTRRDWRAARRIAIDLQGRAARDPNARLVAACRSALSRAEKAASGDLAMPEALAEISDLIASALAASGEVRP